MIDPDFLSLLQLAGTVVLIVLVWFLGYEVGRSR